MEKKKNTHIMKIGENVKYHKKKNTGHKNVYNFLQKPVIFTLTQYHLKKYTKTMAVTPLQYWTLRY